jgi:nucleoid-associated protein YgaU
MGLFSFIKDAGEKLLGMADDSADTQPEMPVPDAKPQPVAVSAATLHLHLKRLGLAPDDLAIGYDAGAVTLKGTIADEAAREKIVLAVGNIAGVESVVEELVIEGAPPASTFYTVQGGDSLSKIAKEQYGDAMKYPVIFEANRPMLSDPNKIYPGQVLRIPALED